MSPRVLCCLLLCLPCLLFAQRLQSQEDLLAFIQTLEPTDEDEGIRQELFLKLDFLINNPLSLNYASEMQMAQIPGIHPSEIQAILAHRQKYGSFLHLAELASVQGLSRQRAALLSSFFEANIQKNSFFQLQPVPKQSLKIRFQSKTSSAYQNDSRRIQPWLQALRLEWKPAPNWNAIIQAEQDPGESWQGKPNFSSGSLSRTGKGICKTAIIGDFQASFSQGLWLGPGFQNQAGISLLQQMRFMDGFKPYRSRDENRYLRGVALDFGWKNWSLQALASFKTKNQLGAFFDSLNGFFSENQFQSDFNTNSVNQVQNERLFGIRLNRKISGWNLALASSWIKYSPPILTRERYPYQWGSRSLENYKTLSFQFRKTLQNGLVSGEALIDNFGDLPISLQWMQSLSANLDAMLAFRYFPIRYSNPHSRAFSRWNQQDEKGLFANLIWQVSRNQQLRTYLDVFDSDWIRYRKPFPVSGSEQALEWRYQKRSGELLACKLQNKVEANQVNEQRITQRQNQLILVLTMPVGDSIKLQSRYQQAFLNANEQGQSYLLWSQMTCKVKPFQFSFRFSVWNCYSSQLPLFSSDLNLPGMFSMASFYGKGHEFTTRIDWKKKFLKSGVRLAWRPQSLNQVETWSLSFQLNLELDGS